MDMRILKTTQNFLDTIYLEPAVGITKLQDIVSRSEQDKVLRLQQTAEKQRLERELNSLPLIYLHRIEEDRVIESVGFGQEDIGHVQFDHQDKFVFCGSDGRNRSFYVRSGLLKKNAIYFIVLILEETASQQDPPPSHMENAHNQDANISTFDFAEETSSIISIYQKIGTLAVRVERARNLPNTVAPRSQQSYCKLTLDEIDKQTRSDLLGGGTPFWYEPWIDLFFGTHECADPKFRDEELQFDVFDDSLKPLYVSVFKQDNGDEALIGSTTVDLSHLITSGGTRQEVWFRLYNRGQPAGDIRLNLRFWNITQPKPKVPTGDSSSKDPELDPQLHAADKNEGAADDEPDDRYANCPVEGCGEALLSTELQSHIEMHEEKQDSGDDQSRRSSKWLGARLKQMRKQVLLKTFWEPEKGVKYCISCGDPFSIFRRKHHCRACGRIFDAKCLTETEGRPLSIEEKLIVCKTCLDVIQRGHNSQAKSELLGEASPPVQAQLVGGNPSEQVVSDSPLYAPISAKIPSYDFAESKFWFVIHTVLEDGRHWVLSRYYEDFYDFQIALLTKFPAEAGTTGTQKRTLPYMPGPVTNVTDEIIETRRRNLNAYLKNLLLEQPEHISRCSLVKQFFTPREGDYEILERIQGQGNYEMGPEDLPGPMSNDDAKLFMDTDVANPSPVEEVPYSEESTQYLIDLLQDFSLSESLALPHGFWPLLEKRIQGILVGTEILPAYKDIVVKRTFDAAYTVFTEPGFVKRIDEEGRVEDLVLTFNFSATKELEKGKAPDDSS
jgi:hypothetical protein